MNNLNWSSTITDLGDRLAALGPTDAAELRNYLGQIHGVQASLERPAQTVHAPPTFAVILGSYDPACKIRVIKEVWELTGWGLREAKNFVEGPVGLLMARLSGDQAEAARTRLEAAGAQVTLRPETPPALALWLDSFDRTRIIPVIKTVRELTGIGLAQAKHLVECCPSVVRTDLTAAEAEVVKIKLEAVGARVSLR